ncbi:profilin [Streptomyces sp. NPDC051364]|uniref:profilin n=1 Tax=Streptomyces sp. NPDC051364 TaxID=3155799 RepID=UPI00342FE13D
MWQAHVDTLLDTKGMDQAAIIGSDGATWAKSNGFSISPAESETLGRLFVNPADATSNGVTVGGNKYSVREADDSFIMGRKGPGGMLAVKTRTAVVVAVYGEGQYVNARKATEQVAEYMMENNY